MDSQTWGALLPLMLIGGALIGGIADFLMTPKSTTCGNSGGRHP